jgi:hypothetical protein
MIYRRHLIYFLLILAGLVGCSPLVTREQPFRPESTLLQNGQTAGQTFLSDYEGLDGIEIYLNPLGNSQGDLSLHLRESSTASSDLANSTLSASSLTNPGFYRFTFPPQNHSTHRDYYLILEPQAQETIALGTAPGDAYLNGAFYMDGQPLDTQLAFRLVYQPLYVLRGLAREGLTWLGMLFVTFFLYVLPGWAVISLVNPNQTTLNWLEKLAVSSGISLAIYPILFLWIGILGFHPGPLYAWLPASLAIVILLWHNRQSLARLPQTLHSKPSFASWQNLAMLIIIALIFLVRFWVIRNLDVPLWGDSYQHTLVTQLLIDRRGLFSSWQPYTDLQSLTYHFGFHSLAAVFQWVTRLPTAQAVLWVGQIMNALAVILLYPLARRLNRSSWSGLVTLLLAGLVFQMPMFYVNWGRYTQLAAQAILPVAIFLIWQALDAREVNRRQIILCWLALAGIALTHYRVFIFAGIFFIAFLLLHLRSGKIRNPLQRTLWISVGVAVLFLPWFIHIYSGNLLDILIAQLSTPASQLSAYAQQYNTIGNLSTYLSPIVWILLPVVIGWRLYRRDTGIMLISLWSFLVLLAANPQWLNLPGAGSISSFAVVIAAYLPASLVLGNGAGHILDKITETGLGRLLNPSVRGHQILSTFILSLLLICAGMWGAGQRRSDLSAIDYALVTRPDLRAADWIRTNTPEKAIFLVNSFFAFNGSAIVGSDGGWWLPLLSLRQTNLPPTNYVFEQSPRPDYRQWVNALTEQIISHGLANPDVIAMLKERGISYVYIGQRQGKVNNLGAALDPQLLLASPNYTPIYRQDRVWIFQLK